MLIDISRLPHETVRDADVCIIGAGAAGITITLEFLAGPARVVVLESGGPQFEESTQRLYQTQIIGLPHKGVHTGRARVFGGSTRWWAAQALPFFAADLAARDWVEDSGWPMSVEELQPYYRRGEVVYNIPPATYLPDTWPKELAAPPAYDASVLLPIYSQYSTTPDFAKQYGPRLQSSQHVEVIFHANVTELHGGAPTGAITHVTARSLEGRVITVRARVFIICTGAIEAARVLLASRGTEPCGVGNQNDLVGRYFQDHLRCLVAPMDPVNNALFHATYDPADTPSVRYRHKFIASPEFQQREQILTACGEVFYDPVALAPVNAAKNLALSLIRPELRPKAPELFKEAAANPGAIVRAALRKVRGQNAEDRSSPYLSIDCEQQPNRDSRVLLSNDLDEIGVPKTVLDWRLTDAERRTMTVFAEAAARELERVGMARVHTESFQLSDKPLEMLRKVEDVYHHMGTTRMNDDPRKGVVDSRCCVHGIDNLYMGSCSVFPTGASSNCTLTLLALCLRMADEIKGKLAAPATSLVA